MNSAVVTSPDGDSVAWLRRDSKLYRQQTMRGLFLAKEYQNSDMASFEAWAKVFEDPANQLR
ncbi:MAG: hypothetical protein GX068_03880 [Bifidobacterium pseudolongum subsp. globosum]|nr:hypothetical protein [Bifidobacterium pseudolongum subsp. globosum]